MSKVMGRPRKQINKKQFESLCAIQCTLEEVCGVLDCCDKTLNQWCVDTYNKTFYEVFKEKRGMGKASLRRMQWKLAEKNATMGIWLGKQYLEQDDKQKIEHSGETTQNVKAEVKPSIDYSKLTNEELMQLESIINKSSES